MGEHGIGEGNARKTIATYDAAGRLLTTKIEGGGTSIPMTETVYSPTTGMQTEQKFACEGSCTGSDDEATRTEYDALGRPIAYEDADGAKTKATYDAYGRPATVTDPRGTETMHYDEASGALTSMEVSGVGTFTAHYDADGNLIESGLSDGLTAKTNYNAEDEPTGLAYTKEADCGASCTWYEESQRSIYGQIMTDGNSLADDRYSYDADGRLTESRETPTGEGCTVRAYRTR